MIRWGCPPVKNPCQLCQRTRAKRQCPGVQADICPGCCGAERENTIDCPLACGYLQEARQHERPVEIPEDQFPNPDIRLTEDFVRQQEPLVVWLSVALAESVRKERAVDSDAREALEAMIRTYRTLQSGLIYETRPQNVYAAAIQEALKQSVEDLRSRLAESGKVAVRDADVLGGLVFLQRLGLRHNNGRRRGRAFVQFLSSMLSTLPAESALA